jgi:hypothetical protein
MGGMRYRFCLPGTELSRQASGWLFLGANILLFITNLANTNLLQFTAAILFMSCSISVILSARDYRWLFWGGAAVIIAYGLASISVAPGKPGIEYLGILTGAISGLLILRGAFQRHTGRQFNLPRLLRLLDRYPLASAGAIEGTGCVLITIGALAAGDIRLFFAALLWTLAHILLMISDEYLRTAFSKDGRNKHSSVQK